MIISLWGAFCRGAFVLGGLLSGGLCPGGFCPGGFCPVPIVMYSFVLINLENIYLFVDSDHKYDKIQF